MLKKIHPASSFSGTIKVPPDKSLTHRAILLSALADGESTIKNPLEAEDCLSTAGCVEALGCKIEKGKGLWSLHGMGLWGFKAPRRPLDCGNSGTTMRLLSGILAAQNFESALKGDASLSTRPMNRVAEPLSRMGAAFQLRNGKFAPFTIRGTKNLRPLHWKNPVASAQVKSAVLLAALHASGETVYEEPTLSRDHTERMLEACDVSIKRNGATVTVRGPSKLKPQAWTIPGDISSAAFFLIGAALVRGARVKLPNVNVNPTRTGILDVLENAGVNVDRKNERTIQGEPVADLIVRAPLKFRPIKINAGIVPRLIDEIPVLAVLAARCDGISEFSGVEELRVKETDRLKALATNLSRIGARVKERPDGLIIHGNASLRGAEIDSFDDHRIAMAFAVAALVADNPVTIRGAECVSISYPGFWNDLDRLCGR